MKTGASISGGGHLALIGLAIFSGALFGAKPRPPMNIAEVTLMSGAEFEAALSAAPEFNADLPPAPEAPNPGEERADVTLAETDAAPTTHAEPAAPDAPARGEAVKPLPDQPADASIADVGERPAGPPAPEASTLVAATEPSPEIAPAAATASAPAPAPRPAPPKVEDVSPEPPPVVTAEPTPEPAPTPAAEPEPAPEPEVAAVEPPPVEEVVPEKLNDATVPAPKLSPPPPTKPREVAEAKKAERLARASQTPETTGATKQAEAPSGGGSTRTVGELSFRDRDALRVGIRGYFSPPTGLPDADSLAVKIRIEVNEAGKITAGPELLQPSGRLDAAHDALYRAGVRALKRAEAAGVFAKLPRDRYDLWRNMNVTFTPREIQFL
ncbi:MAG: hypothetical protein WD969_10565 [Paracoccaceae bacterium]